MSYGCAESELRVSRVNMLLQGNFQGNDMCKRKKKKVERKKSTGSEVRKPEFESHLKYESPTSP